MARAINLIVIHCSATPNGRPDTVADIDAGHRAGGFRRDPAAIRRYQAVLGHALGSVGYHYVIETAGTVRAGRHPSEIGAHVKGLNDKSLGICLIGTDRYSLEQFASLRVLIANMRQQYPAAKIIGHRDCSPDKNGDGVIDHRDWLKICPGFDVQTWLDGGLKPLAANLLEKTK